MSWLERGGEGRSQPVVDEKLVLLPSFQDGPWNGYTRGTASLIYRGTELTIFPEFRFPSPATSPLRPVLKMICGRGIFTSLANENFTA